MFFLITPFYNALGNRYLLLLLSLGVLSSSLHTNATDTSGAISDDFLDDLLGDGTEDSLPDSKTVFLTEFSGYVEITPRVFLNDRNDFVNDQQVLSIAELEFDLSLGNSITSYSRTGLFFDSMDNNVKRFELFEGYLSYDQEHWDLRLGQFVENWGITDTFNPIDILNRRDLSTNLLDTTRLGETGIRTRLLFEGNSLIGEPTIALYFIPWFQKTRFAPNRQRLGLGNNTISFEEKRGFEPKGHEEHVYALRVQSTLNTAIFNADIQLIVANGVNHSPLITPVNTIELAPVYYGNQSIGAGFRAVPNTLGFLAGLTFKLEIVHNNPYKFNNTPIAIPASYTAYVMGFDRDIYKVLANQDQLTLTMEFASETGVRQADKKLFTRPFSRDLITRLYWQAGDFSRSSIELRSIYDPNNNEYIIETTLSTSLLHLHDDLKLALSALYVNPSSEQKSTFNKLPDNTSVAITLRFNF